MKKLSIEEKAKLYDEAIEKATSLLSSNELGNVWIYKVLPELKEGDDEKTRKEIIYHIQNCDDTIDEVAEKRMIDWLEKQGDKDKLIQELGEYKVKYTQELLEKHLNTISDKDDERLRNTTISFLADYAAQGYENAVECIDWLKKQGEHKQDPCEKCDHFTLNCHNFPCIKKKAFDQGKSALEAINEEKVDNANKVEPKFKIGDWITNGEYTWKVISVGNLDYTLQNQLGECVKDTIDYVNKVFHLWTIKDAKDGDFLACNEEILLFKSYSVQGRVSLYCWYNGQINNFSSKGVDNTLLTTRNKVLPATKEQHDLLFQKMHEAGYEWNIENKELKKINIIPLFNVGDTIIKKHNSDIHDFGSFLITDITGGKYWYNDRIICDITKQDEWEIYGFVDKNSFWSENDEVRLKAAITFIRRTSLEGNEDIIEATIDWLKSLKERMKGE